MYLLHIHGSAPEEIRERVAPVWGLDGGRVHEPPRRHRLEHGNVVVSVVRQETVLSQAVGRSVGRSVGR